MQTRAHASCTVPSSVRRSEFNLDKGGAAEVVLAVLDALQVKRATLFGSDWGAGVAISISLKWPDKVDRLVILHASYAEKTRGEMRRIVAPVCAP